MKDLYRGLAALSPPPDRGSLRLLVRAAAQRGAVPRELARWLAATLELPDLTVRDAMVPRVDVIAVPETAELAEAARQMAQHGCKRLPVYRGTIDNPIGVVHAVDVAGALVESGKRKKTVRELARKTPEVIEKLSLVEAIGIMRSQGAHILLVVDTLGGFAGLLTLEDVASHILGPLPAEYGGHDRHSINVLNQYEAIVGGATPLHEIELALNTPLPRDGYASIGGLVYARLKREPRVGDVVELPGMRIEVLSVDGPRLREVRIRTGPALGTATQLVDIGIDKEVLCDRDVVGRVERLIASPDGHVTDFVMRYDDRQVAVPLSAVERTDQGVVYLRSGQCDVDRFPRYEMPVLTDRTSVVASDGPVGFVRQVVVDGTTGLATHVVVRLTKGLLVQRDVVVPLTLARVVSASRIELSARIDDLLALPEYRDDDEIQASLLKELVADPRLAGLDQHLVKVEVKAGVVRLTGRVRTSSAKQAAGEIAERTRGVLAVENDLVADNEIAANVKRALRSAGIHAEVVSVLLGRVKLRGVTPPSPEVVRVVARLPGVESVDIE
jgi:Mg2+/Co2+ transporter CorC